MSDKPTKVDITSTALEKTIDTAKEFLDKLIMSSVEEAGLIIKDQIVYLRFKNQIRILNKARENCERQKVTPKSISLKILAPLLQNATLEDNEELQDKWAILLTNLVDSNQNIENNVFPYLLGQLSLDEFKILEEINKERVKSCKFL
jgi:hypothetical protein